MTEILSSLAEAVSSDAYLPGGGFSEDFVPGIPEELIHELFLKQLLKKGSGSIRSLAASLCVPIEVVESIFRLLKTRQFIEVRGTYGDDFNFNLTVAGKAEAQDRIQLSRYAGPVPVALADYQRKVRSQVFRTKVNRTRLDEAYGDLTLDPALIRRLGPALSACKSMFLYGPSGTGKSSLAERLLRVFHEPVAIPYAIEVDGNIVTVFDPAVHTPVKNPPYDQDPRWVYCSRPCIIVGGELIAEMLEARRDGEAGSYTAPLHMKANNGVFVVDDFGRQQVSPRALLNRWIVPLDRRVDYLTLGDGQKFETPFEVFVVFSTNLNPTDLADEAFLRRIPNKILVDAVAAPVFDEITRRRLEASQWACEPGAAEYLRDLCRTRGGDLRPCYPRDMFSIIESIASFEEREAALTRKDIDHAAELYFSGDLTASQGRTESCARTAAP
jgi:predicted ATPase with chaperone activity